LNILFVPSCPTKSHWKFDNWTIGRGGILKNQNIVKDGMMSQFQMSRGRGGLKKQITHYRESNMIFSGVICLKL